jgi:hypothetical protein
MGASASWNLQGQSRPEMGLLYTLYKYEEKVYSFFKFSVG